MWRFAYVPVKLTLDRPEVIQPGLHLDDDEDPTARIEREQVDPAPRPPADDRHLSMGEPAGPMEATVDVAGAARMDEIALAQRVDQDGRLADQPQLQAERGCDALDDVERWIRLASLD